MKQFIKTFALLRSMKPDDAIVHVTWKDDTFSTLMGCNKCSITLRDLSICLGRYRQLFGKVLQPRPCWKNSIKSITLSDTYLDSHFMEWHGFKFTNNPPKLDHPCEICSDECSNIRCESCGHHFCRKCLIINILTGKDVSYSCPHCKTPFDMLMLWIVLGRTMAVRYCDIVVKCVCRMVRYISDIISASHHTDIILGRKEADFVKQHHDIITSSEVRTYKAIIDLIHEQLDMGLTDEERQILLSLVRHERCSKCGRVFCASCHAGKRMVGLYVMKLVDFESRTIDMDGEDQQVPCLRGWPVDTSISENFVLNIINYRLILQHLMTHPDTDPESDLIEKFDSVLYIR